MSAESPPREIHLVATFRGGVPDSPVARMVTGLGRWEEREKLSKHEKRRKNDRRERGRREQERGLRDQWARKLREKRDEVQRVQDASERDAELAAEAAARQRERERQARPPRAASTPHLPRRHRCAAVPRRGRLQPPAASRRQPPSRSRRRRRRLGEAPCLRMCGAVEGFSRAGMGSRPHSRVDGCTGGVAVAAAGAVRTRENRGTVWGAWGDVWGGERSGVGTAQRGSCWNHPSLWSHASAAGGA